MSFNPNAARTPYRDLERFFKIGMLVTLRETIAPDLWRIYDLEGRIATLEPISLGATRCQMPLKDLRRYRIKTTDEVLLNEDLVKVLRVSNPRSDDLYEYTVAHNEIPRTVREHELTVHVGSAAPDPLALLKNLDAAPAEMALARSELLHAYFKATARSLGIVGYNGARMLPIPHQISAARYVLLFGRPRFLLADEVGLGKTVEAGLIVSTLRKYFPDWKTAFFVPESLTVQWAFEMYGKFGKAIFRLSDDEEPEEGEDDPGVILPHAHAIDWARRDSAEILVIDEAHQILKDPAQYESLMTLSRKAHAVLLLTATPSSDDGRNLVKLLQLADPDHFAQFERQESLEIFFDKQSDVEALLHDLRVPGKDGSEIMERWEKLGIEDEELTARFLSLKVDPSDLAVRHKLAALVTDRYYPRARILRYQRKFLAMDNEMAERIEEPIEYRPTKDETRVRKLAAAWLELLKKSGHHQMPAFQDVARVLIQAVHSSPLAFEKWLEARLGKMPHVEGVSADPVRRYRSLIETAERLENEDDLLDEMQFAATDWVRSTKAVDMKGRAMARLPRYEMLLRQIKSLVSDDEEPHRVLIFTSFECNVRPLYLLLNKALGEDVEVFYISAELEWREREKNAFAFQECPGPCVLISDDLGGEGRNFQFVNSIFHFDLPLAAWIVEQRVGRLDRVGREADLDVDSQILVAPGELDEAIYEFQRDAVNVFNESLAPVEDLIENVTRRMLIACIEGGSDAIRDLIDEVHEEVEKRREKEVRGLMRRSDTGVEDVKRLVPQLNDTDELKRLAQASINYTRLLGSVVDQTRSKYTITIGSHHPLTAFVGILSEMQGHFDRIEAVRHERMEFFSPGHPFVRSLTRGALQESGDRVAFLSRTGIENPAFVFHCRIFLPQTFLEAIRELPEDIQPSLLCSAAGNFGTSMIHVVTDFDGNPIDDADVYIKGFQRSDNSLDFGREIYDYLPTNWETVCESGWEHALEVTRQKASEYLREGLPRFEGVAGEVLTRHFGADFPVETKIDTMLFELDPLSIEIDAVTVIFPAR